MWVGHFKSITLIKRTVQYKKKLKVWTQQTKPMVLISSLDQYLKSWLQRTRAKPPRTYWYQKSHIRRWEDYIFKMYLPCFLQGSRPSFKAALFVFFKERMPRHERVQKVENRHNRIRRDILDVPTQMGHHGHNARLCPDPGSIYCFL